MADKAIRGITVEIGGDTTKLGKALESSETKSRSLQTELHEIQKALKLDPTNVDLLSQKQEVLTKNIGETRKKLDTLKEAEKQVIAQFQRGEVAEEQVRALQREIIKTEKSIDDMESEVAATTKALKDLADGTDKAEKHTKEYKESVKKAKDELSDFKDKAKDTFDTIGKGAAVLGGAVVATGSYALKLTTDFDKAFNTLTTRTGASADEMDELNESMKRVYANNFGESIEDVAESMATVKNNTDLAGEELQQVTEYAILLRDTFDFEVNESTRSAKMLMDQYGISAEEAYNLIAQGAQNGLDKNGDLLDTINEYAVHFNQLGIDAPTMFNMLVNGAKNGTFSVDKLGDAVKEFGIRVKDGTADEAFVELGLAIGDVSEELKDATDDVTTYEKKIADLEDKLELAKVKQSAFNYSTSKATKLKVEQDIAKYSAELAEANDKLAEAKDNVALLTEYMNGSGKSVDELKNAFSSGGEEAKQALLEVTNALFAMEDPVKQNQLGVELFGTMWEDMGAEGVKALLSLDGSIATTNDALTTINEQKYDDIGSALQGLGRTLETDVIKPLGEELKPVVEDAIEYVKTNGPQIKDILSNVVSKIGEFVRFVVDNGPAILSIIGGIGAGFVTWKVASMINAVVGAIQAFKIANEGATIAQWAMNAAMNANPIGIIITLIAGLVTAFILLWNNCEGFRNFWIGLWDGLMNVVSAVGDWLRTFFTETIPNIFNTVVNFFKENWQNILLFMVNPFAGAFKLLYEKNENFRNFVDGILTSVGQFFSNTWTSIKDGAAKAWDGITSVFSNVGSFFSNAFSNAWTAIKDIFSKWGTFFSDLWGGIKDTFSKIGTNIGDAIGSSVKAGVNGVISAVERTINKAIGLINGAIGIINNIPGVSIGKIDEVSFARLAKGGIVKRPTFAEIGEDGAEAIIPLERNTEWVDKVAQRLGQNNSTGNSAEVLTALDRIYDRLNRLQVVLDSGALIGETIDKIDSALADKQLLNERGV